MSTILESTKILLGQADARSNLARLMDVEPEIADVAVLTAVPALIKAMADRAELADGSEAIGSIVELDDGSIVADVPLFLDGRKPALGNGMLDVVLGTNRGDAAIDIAAVGKVAPVAVRKMLPMLMPIVVGIVAKQRKDRVWTDDEVVDFLAAERSLLDNAAALNDVPVLAVASGARFPLFQALSLRWIVVGVAVAVGLAWLLSVLSSGQSDAAGLAGVFHLASAWVTNPA